MSFGVNSDIADQVAALQHKFRAKAEKLDSDMKKAVNSCCLKVERDLKAGFSPNGPSAPGEAPAVDSGRERSAITHRVETESGVVAGHVGVSLDPNYPFMVEFGTSKMAPRPLFIPTIEKDREWIKNKLAAVVKDPESVGSAE